MARRIMVLCDVCLHDEGRQNPDAEELPPIGIGNKKPRVLALCQQHREDFYEPFQGLLDDLGQVVTDLPPVVPKTRNKKEQPIGNFPCTVPGCDRKGEAAFKYKKSLRDHVQESHGLSLAEMYEQHGDGQESTDEAAELTEEDLPAEDDTAGDATAGEDVQAGDGAVKSEHADDEWVCPEEGCDKVYSRELGNSHPKRAGAIHLARAHGIRGARHQAA